MSQTERLRVGVVPFLNARLVVWALEHAMPPDVELVYDVPSGLSARLEAGELEVAVLPIFEYLRGVGDRIIPQLSISSYGPVESVKLFARRPLDQIRVVALDTGSRTSQALVRIILAERYHVEPEFLELTPNLDEMLGVADAALLIGNACLTAAHPAVCAQLDLGEAWFDWHGLPFVFAVWAISPWAPGRRVWALLREAQEGGLSSAARIAREVAQTSFLAVGPVEDYLTHTINYDLTDQHVDSIRRFGDLCVRHGLLPAARPLRFADLWTGL